MSVLVSILIPVHNGARFLAQAIESALAQSWPTKEIIVVDDGSTDDSAAIASRYLDRGVRLVQQQKSGAASARNRAFAESSGEWLQWLDADDLLSTNKVEAQMHLALEAADSLRLYSCMWGSFYYRSGAAHFVASELWQDLSPADWLCHKLASNVYMQTSTWLMSRELAARIGPWNESLLVDDDGEYFCRALAASNGVRFVSGAKVYYRKLGGNSLSMIGRDDGKPLALWLSMQLHMRTLLALEDDVRTRNACAAYMSLSLLIFSPHHREIVQELCTFARQINVNLHVPVRNLRYRLAASIMGADGAELLQRAVWNVRKFLARNLDFLLYKLGC